MLILQHLCTNPGMLWDAFAPSQAIMKIAVGAGASALAQGSVFGPLVSKYMHDFIDAKYPGDVTLSPEEIASLYPEMRAAGVDLETNFRAKNVESVFGPMAEARYWGQSFDEVWRDPTNADDVREVHEHAGWMGITDPAAVEECVQVAKRTETNRTARRDNAASAAPRVGLYPMRVWPGARL
jgi:hypothetical protein